MSEWIESKNKLPPLGEVIEAIGPKEWFYSKLGRGYFALVEIDTQLCWILPSLCDLVYERLAITHWRHIAPNPKGKKPFVKIIKNKGCWYSKVYFKYVDQEN